MTNFTYQIDTKIIFGKDEHKNVGKIISDYDIKRVLLHYGGGSIKSNGCYDDVISSLKEYNIEYFELGGVEPNPKVSLVRKGVEICKKENIQLILAVGGGSVIDSAKAIGFSALCDNDPWDYFEGIVKPSVAIPVGVILTLSASGSEMSSSCVITNDELGLKRGCGTELNRPKFSILNPELTYSVNKYQTACGIVDIMMHTLERYMTKSGASSPTDDIAEAIVKSTMKNGLIALEDPNNYEARAALMWDGTLSHNGLTGLGREYFMISHQIEHEISGMFDRIAHGAGLAIVFPAWCKWAYKYDIPRFLAFSKNIMGVNDLSSDEETILCAIDKLYKFFESIGMPTHLSDVGINDDSVFVEMAEKCTRYGKRILGGFINYGVNEIVEILNIAK